MKKYREDCYYYHEAQEMSAHVPNCMYDSNYEYGFCPCNENCEHYISKTQAYGLIKNIVRCKECKNGEKSTSPYHQDYWCNAYECYHDGEWFCADGRRNANG